MPAIHSYAARDIRLGDIVTQHRDGTTHNGTVEATPDAPTGMTNLVVNCQACHGEIEIWKLFTTSLVTGERNPARARDTTAQTAASIRVRANA